MSTATITVVLPTTRVDGSAFPATAYGSCNVYKDGNLLDKLTAPTLVATDTGAEPGVSVYTVEILDTQVPPQLSARSQPVTCPSLTVTVLSPPSTPSLTISVV